MVVTSPIKNRIAFRYFFLCLPSHIFSFQSCVVLASDSVALVLFGTNLRISASYIHLLIRCETLNV